MVVDRYYFRTVFVIATNALDRQYRTSFLGIGWMLIIPMMQVVILTMIVPVIRGTPHDTDYFLYLVSTFPLWSFIIGSLMVATRALIAEAETIKRCMISTTVFPLSAVLQQFYAFTVSFLVMMLVSSGVSGRWHTTVLLVPVYLVPVLVTVSALAIALAYLTPYVHDVPECVHVAASVLFWLTPVVYPISAVPARAQSWFALNPVFVLIRPISDLTYAGVIPSVAETAALLVVMVIAMTVGYAVRRGCGRNFVYYL